MRFLHTADWQIGMKARHVGEAADRVREERLKSAQRVIDAARKNAVEFVLVAGDTFEDNGVDRVMVQKVADILGSADVPVFVIPGNHDPLMPGSVWEHPVWKSTGNVHVLRNREAVEVPDGLLYPCPVREKRSRTDPTAWIQAREAEAIQIGIAHGTVAGIHQEEPDNPIPRDAAARAGLDYLALGHWHSTVTYESPDGTVRMAYSGTHEPTRFGERDSGNVLLIDVPAAGERPVVTPFRTSSLDWRAIKVDLRGPGDLVQVRKQIESMENPGSILLELKIAGLLAADDRDELNRIREILESRFLWGCVDASQVRPSPEDESWVANLPAGILRQAGTRLQELADPNFAGERAEGATPEVAARALIELYAMLGEPQA